MKMRQTLKVLLHVFHFYWQSACQGFCLPAIILSPSQYVDRKSDATLVESAFPFTATLHILSYWYFLPSPSFMSYNLFKQLCQLYRLQNDL